MKKLLLLFLLVPAMFFSQDKNIDKANRILFDSYKNIDVEFPDAIPILTTAVNKIKSSTTDAELVGFIDLYISQLNKLTFETARKGSLKNTINLDLSKFAINTDKFTDVTLITNKRNRQNDRIYSRIVIKGEYAYLYITTYFRGIEWLFKDKLVVMLDDKKFNFTLKDVKREAFLGGVAEMSSFQLDDEMFANFIEISNSDNTIVCRFSGTERNSDFTLSVKEKANIKFTIDLYKVIINYKN